MTTKEWYCGVFATTREYFNSINELLDENGYPTDEWIEFIFDFKPDDSFTIMDFVACLKDGWWMPQSGYRFNRGVKNILELHTGGWSGNEEIMSAILSNYWLSSFKMIYIKWEIGGHHYFEIKEWI